eukprot:gene15737-17322_t
MVDDLWVDEIGHDCVEFADRATTDPLGSSLAYDGLHDRSLKHYYRSKKIKQQIQQMNTPDELTGREKQVKKRISKTMLQNDVKPNPISPYAVSLIQPQNEGTVAEKYRHSHHHNHKPKKRAARKQSKSPQRVVGRAPRMERRAPDEHVPIKEKERLVNMATKLIVATETVALPRNRKATKDAGTDSYEKLPPMQVMQGGRRRSSSSDPGPRIGPKPPESQNGRRRKGPKPPKWEDSSSGDISLDSTLDSVSQMRHLNIDTTGDSYVVSSDDKKKASPPRWREEPHTTSSSQSSPKPRPRSSGYEPPQQSSKNRSTNQDEFDYEDDFFDVVPEDYSPLSSPRAVWKAHSPVQSTESSTQTVETKGTQTVKKIVEKESQESILNFYEKLYPESLQPKKPERPMSASTGTQIDPFLLQEDTKRGEPARTGNYFPLLSFGPLKKWRNLIWIGTIQSLDWNDSVFGFDFGRDLLSLASFLDQTVVSYEIFVVTGDKLGAGTSSDVKICLFGKLGDSGERPLIRSKTNRNPFERKQVDIFVVDSICLGDLTILRIGHNGTALGSGWFLDKVVVRESEHASKSFEFKCDRWLSARDDDGQIVRDLPLSNILPGNGVPDASATNRSFFKQRPDSASSTGSGKIKFRPLSASMGRRKEATTRQNEAAFTNRPAEEDGDGEKKRSKEKPKKMEELEDRPEKFNKSEMKMEGKLISKKTKNKNKEELKKTEGEDDAEFSSKEAKQSIENIEDVEEPTATEEDAGDDAAKELSTDDAANSADVSSNDENGSTGNDTSDVFSVSDGSSSSERDDSEKDDDTSHASESDDDDEDEAIERVEKDTSKKEEPSREEERKKSLQQEYAAGFLAGVKASKSAEEHHEEPKDDSMILVSAGPNIHQASESGDFVRIKQLVDEIPELKSKPDERGWTPLHTVAAFGHLDILKWLSVNGVNLTEETPTGYSPIHLAALNGHVNCIMVLAAMGCPLNCKSADESTPLHLSAMSGHVECVKWLVANRANDKLCDLNGRTPLDLAEEYQHEECAKILKLLEREMERKDSVLTMLRHADKKELAYSNPEASRGADSGVGGIESGDDPWISDAEDEVIGRSDRPASGISRKDSFGAAKARKQSKQEERETEQLEEKRKVYEKQQRKMQRKESSFLDSIRQEIDDKSEEDF